MTSNAFPLFNFLQQESTQPKEKIYRVHAIGQVNPIQEQSPTPGESNKHACLENRLFAMPLPQNITQEQRQVAISLIREAEPRLTILHAELRTTLDELGNLSYTSDTPPDALATLGRRLVAQRREIILELRRISLQVEKKAGFNPYWGATKSPSLSSGIPDCEPCD